MAERMLDCEACGAPATVQRDWFKNKLRRLCTNCGDEHWAEDEDFCESDLEKCYG